MLDNIMRNEYLSTQHKYHNKRDPRNVQIPVDQFMQSIFILHAMSFSEPAARDNLRNSSNIHEINHTELIHTLINRSIIYCQFYCPPLAVVALLIIVYYVIQTKHQYTPH